MHFYLKRKHSFGSKRFENRSNKQVAFHLSQLKHTARSSASVIRELTISDVFVGADQENLSIVAQLKASTGSVTPSYWGACIHLILVSSGVGSLSHGSQSIYPVFRKDQLHFSDALISFILVAAYSCVLVVATVLGY